MPEPGGAGVGTELEEIGIEVGGEMGSSGLGMDEKDKGGDR